MAAAKPGTIVAVSASLILLTGCLPSIHPLYSDGQTVFREELVGNWRRLVADHTGIEWRLESVNDEHYRYSVPMDDEQPDIEFIAHLVELDGELYLDSTPVLAESTSRFVIRPHYIMQIRIDGDSIETADIDRDWLKTYLNDHPDELEVMQIDDGIVVIDSTEALQEFVTAHVDEGLFNSPHTWRRREP